MYIFYIETLCKYNDKAFKLLLFLEVVFYKQNRNLYWECKSDVGNPPPLAYWSKDGNKIGDFGYKDKKLTMDNITKGEAAIYFCNVKSHNLTDRENITLGKKLV